MNKIKMLLGGNRSACILAVVLTLGAVGLLLGARSGDLTTMQRTVLTAAAAFSIVAATAIFGSLLSKRLRANRTGGPANQPMQRPANLLHVLATGMEAATPAETPMSTDMDPTTVTWPPAWTLKPTDGQPHDDEEYEGIGWDLSFGCAFNVGHDDHEDVNSPLTIGAHFSDADRARGFVEREVTPEQLVEFARLLLNLAAKHRQRQESAGTR